MNQIEPKNYMIQDKALTLRPFDLVKLKAKDYAQLVKLRLNLTVIFSTAIGFLLALESSIIWIDFFALIMGGFLIVGSANALNQIMERESDKLMSRTLNRPLAQNRMSVQEAAIFASFSGIIGVVLMGLYLNELSALISLTCLLVYAFAYTPLKKLSPIAVFVGAISGACPPLAGYVAVSNEITSLALILFGIQFFWQFPHFWAIAWVMNDDYQKAGFKLLPGGSNKDKRGALQMVMFTVVLLPLVLFPAKLGLTTIGASIICLVISGGLLYQTFRLYQKLTNKAALHLMFGSFIYLPLILLVLFFDKLML